MDVCYLDEVPEKVDNGLPFDIGDLPPDIRLKIDDIVRNNEDFEAQIDAIDALLFGMFVFIEVFIRKMRQNFIGKVKLYCYGDNCSHIGVEGGVHAHQAIKVYIDVNLVSFVPQNGS